MFGHDEIKRGYMLIKLDEFTKMSRFKIKLRIPVSVQAAIRFITLGCSPTVAIISSSFLRSRVSFSVAFSKN